MFDTIKVLIRTLVAKITGRKQPPSVQKTVKEQKQKKTQTKKEAPTWRPIALSYKCWGCGAEERLTYKTETTPTPEEIYLWQHKWGPKDKSLKLLFRDDGTYTPEEFCPACQQKIEEEVKQYKWGYLASEVAATLRKPQDV